MLKILFKKFWAYIVIGILSVALWGSMHKAVAYHKKSNVLENTISDLNQQIKYTEIRLNDSIKVYQAEVKSLNVTKENLRVKYDKLLNASKLKPKDVNSVTEIKTIIHDVDTVPAVIDSFGGISAKLEDDFVKIDVEILPDRNTIIDYEIRDSLTVVSVQKKRSILFGLIKWKKPKSIRVINHNPKANIVSLQTINVIE
ncbi:hypothetical protein [Bacteroides caccae]|uniref:hypothetical protein n=1 Tax=Bacteroides caccae TaxID=47678 RepID=UPI00356ABE21